MAQINGFFKDTALRISDESSLKLWSINMTLEIKQQALDSANAGKGTSEQFQDHNSTNELKISQVDDAIHPDH